MEKRPSSDAKRETLPVKSTRRKAVFFFFFFFESNPNRDNQPTGDYKVNVCF